MSRRLAAAAWAALVGALSGVVLLALFYLLHSSLRIDFDVEPPRLMTGMHPPERDRATGLTFAWTSRDVALRLPGLDRRVEWSLNIRLRGARSNQSENPAVVILVDGIQALVHQSHTDFDEALVTIPVRAARPRGVLITIQPSSTFVPGPQDQRPLGVLVDSITLSAGGLALPPWPALAGAAWSASALGAAVALIGVTPGLAVGAAVAIAAGQASVAARGFAPFTGFPELSVRIAVALAIVLVVAVLAGERLRAQPLRNTARFAAAFTVTTLFLKLLVLLHPNMPTGDALFQAHRFHLVLGGNYHFTSIAPGNYQFPYAPGLYVAAAPFADLVRREAGDVMLLRIVVASADALAALLIYVMIGYGWGNRQAAAIAAAIYLLMPLDFGIAAGGTLTSAFAQSVAVFSLVLMAAHWIRLERPLAVAALAAALSAAYMSHTSTFAILAVSTVTVAATFVVRGGRALRSPALAVAAASAIALALSIVLYYGHFTETYRTELNRIGSETATAAPDAGGRTIAQRAEAVPRYLREYLGIPAIVLAGAGLLSGWRRGARDRLTLTLAGWGVACLAFLILGVATPVDMRYYLAALPLIAAYASAAASEGWTAGGSRRLVTVVLLMWCLWLGVDHWWHTLAN